jgi:TIR domain
VPGLDWGAAIIDAINDAKVMVLIFSSSANTSKQIKREVERAVSKGVTLIPLRIEDVPLGKTLEYFISSEHWMDALSRPLEPHVDRLADAIRALLARPSKSIDTGVRIARKASGAHPAAASLPEPHAQTHAQTHAQPAAPPAVSRPGKFRPIPLAAAGAGFYLQTGIPQRITLKAVITDRAGHDSNPVPFSFEAVPVPVAPVAPPALDSLFQNIALAESVLAADQGEWLRLMIEAEWYG